MFEIKKYLPIEESKWNDFISTSKNGTFLFDRKYMDYHLDKFTDYSLLIYRKGKLYSVFPANIVNDTIYSHQGLTYGGFIMSKKATSVDMIELVKQVGLHLKNNGIKRMVYKAIPFIYHSAPAQEDLYALFKCCHLKAIWRNLSSTIYQCNRITFNESRKSGLRKALKNDLYIKQSDNFSLFWEILEDNLKERYGTTPVHSLDEIQLLNSRFPQNIKLYMVFKNDTVVGGTVIYITKQVIHTQYISASIKGKEFGALDLLFDFLINKEYENFPYFDFGQSTEEMGLLLNETLIFQKEGFGGRGVLYDIYEYEL